MGEDLARVEGLLALGDAGGVGLVVGVLVAIFAFYRLAWSLTRFWGVSGRHCGVGGAMVAWRPSWFGRFWEGKKLMWIRERVWI